MGLNKLDNFIKNTEGRILYVSPSDLDSTDAITNTGNSLAQPFKTIQRALLEAARFSFLQGKNNDLIERTTILVFPGEHIIDNRPGYAIYNNNGSAYAVPPTGGLGTLASGVLSLELDSNFDLTQEDNILYKFNSVYGGVIVPRGTSIVGLDLRKTKIRPKYVPNPTDSGVKSSSIFKTTGGCYFWQFSFFDGDDSGTVYTHPSIFTENYKSKPNFSHHKLFCFEYADGVNPVGSYGLTDLDIYYSKLSNAFNSYREIPVGSKFPTSLADFAKRDPEWQIVGALASDPVSISNIYSGNGTTASARITVTTSEPHNLNTGTPIKIREVSASEYNISTFVQEIISDTQFTYLLNSFPITLPVNPSSSGATVTIETDTVSGASPYIFNCSLRSVWGMNGLHADGSKSSGFRSMVTAQFTAISLQKDDRAFVKYDPVTRTYNGVSYTTVYGKDLPTGASQTDSGKAYHLDPKAIYRQGWESSHLKISNDGFIQIVSVFAIGFNKHFDLQSGADASITNSNSNFGQISLSSDGFKAEAFDKDNKAFITSIIPPRDIDLVEENIEWLSIDVGLTTSVGISSHLYLYGFDAEDSVPINTVQGYQIGARVDDKLYLSLNGTEYSANIYMYDEVISSSKKYNVSSVSNSTLTLGTHLISTGEKIIINSESGDLPENVIPHSVYYAIRVNSTEIKLSSSFTDAKNGEFITIYGGNNLVVYSRVSDKNSGEIGSPIQYDFTNKNWFINVNSGNQIYNQISNLGVSGLSETTDLCYVKRISDSRSLDEKIYKIRVVIPKELIGAKEPQNGYIIQESSTTGAGPIDFTRTTIDRSDYEFKKNQRFITTCSVSSNTVTVLTELPHNLNLNDVVIIRNVTDSGNPSGTYDIGYNGKFKVSSIIDQMSFQYSTTDVNGIVHAPTSSSTNNINNRTTAQQVESLPRFERNDLQSNLYVYRNEVISPYIQGIKDGIYHLYILNASNRVIEEFVNLNYSQSSVDLYPQLDRDNVEADPPAAKTFALRSPIGDVNTSDLKKSITRETIDKTITTLGIGLTISNVSNVTSNSVTLTFSRNHDFNGISSGSIYTPNSNYTTGTFYDVKLLGNNANPSLGTWKGATAKVIVSTGGTITSADIISPGCGYTNGEVLYFDSSRVGAGIGATFTIQTNTISSSAGNVIQITGIGTTNTEYYRIVSVGSTTQISIAKSSGDSIPIIGQYAFEIGPSILISNVTSFDSSTGISTFTCATAHGLVSGNKFKVIDSSNNNLGNYLVKERIGVTTFTAITNKTISANGGYILKHGLSANQSISNIQEENIAARHVTFYGKEIAKLNTAITTEETFSVSLLNSQIGLNARFPMGTYIQIDNEIMRIKSSNNTTQFTVIRGSMGTKSEPHSQDSLIRKIKPISIEFRRPSTLRASGHTFEYLGYGPGNYSTALPQVQVNTLTEREEFLVQSQERSGGIVVYSGMNNNGDFFNGNTKTSSVSGEIISYDIPKPTVTGENSSKSNVVYDEVTIKERLFVEGGDSGTVLSQFDGPVTFNKQIRAKDNVTLSGLLRNLNSTSSDSPGRGAFTVKGGVGIGENLNVGGNSNFIGNVLISNTTDSSSITTGALRVLGGVGISKRLTTNSLSVNQSISVGSTIVVSGSEGITSPKFKITSPLIGAGGVSPDGPLGVPAILRSNGTQSFITSSEVTAALGFTPANTATVTGDFPLGNSLVCNDISSQFNGIQTEFELTIGTGNTPFIPAGSSANLLVSLGGVIQKPGTDFYIVTTNTGNNTNIIKFSSAPYSGVNCFIVALGGQGSLSSNVDWTTKGDIYVATAPSAAAPVALGEDWSVLTSFRDDPTTSTITGVRWVPIVPVGSVFYMAASTATTPRGGKATIDSVDYYAPEGYLICNGDSVIVGPECQGINISRLTKLRDFLGSTYGNGLLPNLINRFVGYSAIPGTVSGSADATLVSHTHTVNNSTAITGIASTLVNNVSPTLFVADHQNFTTSTISINTAGSSAVNANLPPYLGMLPVIKY